MTTIDLSRHNGPINWPAVSGVERVVIRCTMGATGRDDQFAANWNGSRGIARRGCYHYVTTNTDPQAQVNNILAATGGDFGNEPLTLDCERTEAERLRMAAGWQFPRADYTDALRLMLLALAPHCPNGLRIYTSKVEWEAITTQPLWALGYLHWLAHWNSHVSAPNVPAGWDWQLWQFGTGTVAGIAEPVDVSREKVSPMSDSVITHGPKLGLHSIQPGNTLALVQKALDHGWHWPVVKILHDASVCADVKRISPQTLTICRYMPPSISDEGLQGVEGWSLEQMQAWAKRLIDNCLARTSAAHLPAVDYFDLTNEPDPAEGEFSPSAILAARAYLYPSGGLAYAALGLAFSELAKQADAAHIHLTLPAFPQGVPEYDEMIALVETGLFGLMKKGGHIFDVHEGVFTDQPIDFGWLDVIPGGDAVPGAGSTNFRHRYLYSLLERRGEVVPLVISEFYGGGRYTNSPADQLARFAWYDSRARAEPYLLAFLPFTINSDATWAAADYGPTYASAELWQYIDREKDLPNSTGDDMADILAARAAIAAAQAQLTAAVAALSENWWDALPNGPLTPARKTHPNVTSLPLYSSATIDAAYALRTVDPATYVIDVYARSGSRFQVTNNPSNLVWVDAANVVAFS